LSQVLYSQNFPNAVAISPRKFSLGTILMGALSVEHRGSDGIGSRPFALVGHSFGGLVIKALVYEARRSSRTAAKKFLENLKLVVFYAVPHSGVDAETLTGYVNSRPRGAASCLPENMKPFSTKMAKMSIMMQDAFYDKKINIYAFGEGQPTHGKVCTHALILGFCFLHK